MAIYDTLIANRKTYPTPMSNAQLGALLNETAWAHRAEGYGQLKKPTGANCPQPTTGTLVSRDILCVVLGANLVLYDCLIDAEGKATPTWDRKESLQDLSRWTAPVEPTGGEKPIAPPATGAQPYPDEPTWWHQFEQEEAACYAQAGQALDWEAFRWSARTAYDIAAGLEKEAAKAKHFAEMRAELGLPAV